MIYLSSQKYVKYTRPCEAQTFCTSRPDKEKAKINYENKIISKVFYLRNYTCNCKWFFQYPIN